MDHQTHDLCSHLHFNISHALPHDATKMASLPLRRSPCTHHQPHVQNNNHSLFFLKGTHQADACHRLGFVHLDAVQHQSTHHSPNSNQFFYSHLKRKLPLIVLIFDHPSIIFRMYNGRHYRLHLSQLGDSSLSSCADLSDLWRTVHFHELLVPCHDHSAASSVHTCDCDSLLVSPPQVSLIQNHSLVTLPLLEITPPPPQQHFSTFQLEIMHYKRENLLESQIILYVHALTGRFSSSHITPQNMRDLYNAFKTLLKSCAHKADTLHHYFKLYSKYADKCIGHLCRAWLFMQCGMLHDERSKFKAYTLLNQIKLDSHKHPKQTAFVYFCLGRLQKSNDEAINLYTKAIELDPINTCIYNNRASRYKQTSPELSIQDYTAAIELDPTDPHLYYNRAIMCKKYMQDAEQACSDFTKTLELNPGNVNALYFRALLYHMHLNEVDKALADYTAVIQLATDRRMLVKAFYSRGSLRAVHLDEPAAALDDFNSALKLNPLYDNALFNKKLLLVKLRKFSCIGNV